MGNKKRLDSPEPFLISSRALAGGEMGLKIGGEKFERAFNWRTRHGDEITKAFAFVKSEDFSELLEDRLAALPLLNLLQQ